MCTIPPGAPTTKGSPRLLPGAARPPWQGLLWLRRKHLAQRPRHLPFSGPDGDPHFPSSGAFPALTGRRGWTLKGIPSQAEAFFRATTASSLGRLGEIPEP